MCKERSRKSLAPGSADYVMSAARAAFGAVPFVGSLLIELAGTVVPNQRIEHIAKFAQNLSERLLKLEEGFVRAQLANEAFTDLLEEALRQAARAITDERRDYIAALVANSLSREDIEYSESKHLLRILGEMNDVEVIWLRVYLHPALAGDKDFRERHKSVLEPVPVHFGVPQWALDKAALQRSYREHLAQLGLLQPIYKRRIRQSQSLPREPEFDSSTGALQLQTYQLTALGSLLLRHIGLAPSHDE